MPGNTTYTVTQPSVTDSAVSTSENCFVPQYVQGFERSTPLKNTDPLKDLQETIISIPEGFPADRIPENPVKNPFILTLLLIVFFFFAFTFKKGVKFFGELFRSVLNVKERQNLFDETTIRETQLRLVLLGMTFLFEGYFLFNFMNGEMSGLSSHTGMGVAAGTLVAIIFYYLQKWTFKAVGLLFTDASHTEKWIESFLSVNTAAGIPLAIAAILSLFVPTISGTMIVVAAGIYAIMRILFIYKGFKIFYANMLDLFYFVLYLCALEIVPLFWVYKSSELMYTTLLN